MTDLIVVGAGLTGLFAAALAARRGLRVTVIAAGRGGLELSHGCIDVFGAAVPLQAIPTLSSEHPYQRAGASALQAALVALQELAQEAGTPYVGGLTAALHLPTALGALHPTALAPEAQAAGDLATDREIALAGLPAFRDFSAPLAATALERRGVRVTAVLELPLIDAPQRRDAYATDLARLFDDPVRRAEIARAWKPRLAGMRRVGLPAVLGWERHTQVYDDLQERLGLRLCEIPTPPPSLPGLRLERLLRRTAQSAGALLIEGAQVAGVVDGRSGGRRLSGVAAHTAGGARLYPAQTVLLATGGVLHGGLQARVDGRVQESVLDLPVRAPADRAAWTAACWSDPQPYARFGLRINERMQPIGADGRAAYENLYAAGGLLAGADRGREGSRQGIDLASAFRAVEVLTA